MIDSEFTEVIKQIIKRIIGNMLLLAIGCLAMGIGLLLIGYKDIAMMFGIYGLTLIIGYLIISRMAEF